VLYKFQFRTPKKSDACYQWVAKLEKKPKPYSENDSDADYYKCKECGNSIEKNQLICEKCGLSIN